MKTPRSLHAELMYWLGGYAVLLTGAIALHGFLVNEFAENLVWESLLTRELEHYLERKAEDPTYNWYDTDALQLYSVPGRKPPPPLSGLTEGVHDSFWLGDRETVVLIRHWEGVEYAMVLDITELEAREATLTLFVLGLALALVMGMGALIAWGLRRSLRPLSNLAQDIGALAPDRAGQRITAGDKASSELHVIASALNDYLQRQEEFVERERVFNDTASHELRTPIAVIAGASELALEQPGLPPAARHQVQRILRTARSVEQLITLLLTLAKDPARLARNNDTVLLHELLLEIIGDHRHLMQDKALTIVVDGLAPCAVEAPLHIVQVAIGNLLRNAIENSDQGEVRIRLDAGATVTIEDPGHGMTSEEISRIYAQIARGGGREGGGIGLELLGRLCEHLGWTLSITSTPGKGTLSRLGLSDRK
ncbi:MAG: HAMP domain-containing histidine kinase [Xanthomonadaceae bacterium]|nr:HAMP domain-containing histidine kinase [Xanthomonadaceae bacterium]